MALVALAAIAACDDTQGPGTQPQIETVELEPRQLQLAPGSTHQLTARAKTADGRLVNGPLAWASADTAIASVSTAGIVTARSPGYARISVSSAGRSDTAHVTVTYPAPGATSVTPSSIEAGSPSFILTVAGSGFGPATTVRWNGAERLPLEVTAAVLRVEIPASDIADAGTAFITVHNPAPGGGASAALAVEVRAATGQNPQPVAGLLAPSAAPAGSGATVITVFGVGFIPASRVLWNGTERPTTYVSASELRVDLTAADLAATGTAQVQVRNPAPGGGSSASLAFGITAPPQGNPVPVVSMVAPNVLNFGSAAQEVVVYGTGFMPGSVVHINGAPRTTEYGGGALRFTMPAADLTTPRTLSLTVVNPAPGGGPSSPWSVHVRACCFGVLYEGQVGGRSELLAFQPISGPGPIRLLPGVTAREPSPSPDGRRIAYVGTNDAGNVDIYIVDVQTRAVQRLTTDAAVEDQPSWSPDGTRIAYRSLAGGRSSVWVAAPAFASGWHHTRLSPADVDEERPSWSPSSERIAVAGNAAGSVDIWTMRANGTDRQRVTSSAAQETEPTWSPNGLLIAYTHIAPSGAATIRLAASGQSPIWIPDGLLGEGRLAAWSPDGGRIAFTIHVDGRDQIATMRSDGTDRQVFTFDPAWGGGTNAAWIRQH